MIWGITSMVWLLWTAGCFALVDLVVCAYSVGFAGGVCVLTVDCGVWCICLAACSFGLFDLVELRL